LDPKLSFSERNKKFLQFFKKVLAFSSELYYSMLQEHCLKEKITMKKKLMAALALVLVAVLILGACGNGGGTQTRLIMATGGTAGTYYPLGGAMAGVLNNHTDMQITVNASGASADNIQQIGRGDTHIAFAQNDVMYYAFTGTSIWSATAPVTNLATLMTLYPETIQIVVEANSGIYSVYELAGRRVSVGDIGSGVNANATQVLAAHGLTMNDINEFNLNFGQSADALRDGTIDAFFVTAATPNTAINELATGRDLRLLSLDDAVIANLIADYPFYVRVVVDSSDYTWITAPVVTVAVQATLIASTDMDDDIAYNIVRTLIERSNEVAQGHARGAYISPENAVQSVSVPFHPGAERFFREIGALS